MANSRRTASFRDAELEKEYQLHNLQVHQSNLFGEWGTLAVTSFVILLVFLLDTSANYLTTLHSASLEVGRELLQLHSC
jgi:hypothetical protein